MKKSAKYVVVLSLIIAAAAVFLNLNVAKAANEGVEVVMETGPFTYTGKAISPGELVKYNGTLLDAGTDYTIEYSDNVNVGTATVTITPKGDYAALFTTQTINYDILPKATKLIGLTPASGSILVQWNEQAVQTTGYQIGYAFDSAFTKNAKTLTLKKNTYVKRFIRSLSGKKKYYVRIRTYKTVSGKNYYSAWSDVKSAKTKAIVKNAAKKYKLNWNLKKNKTLSFKTYVNGLGYAKKMKVKMTNYKVTNDKETGYKKLTFKVTFYPSSISLTKAEVDKMAKKDDFSFDYIYTVMDYNNGKNLATK